MSDEADKWAGRHRCVYFETSALSGAGTAELFESVARRLVDNHPSESDAQNVNLVQPATGGTSGSISSHVLND
jgi:hypothetical protein